MSGLSATPVHPQARERAFATLILAFAPDPVERWLYPDGEQYLSAFAPFLGAFGGRAFDSGTVWSLDDVSAVALWLPPGVEADGEAIVAALTATVAPEKHADTYAVLDQMDAAHPTFPHWYLPWLGVDPAAQGRGLGGALLDHCLAIVDADHLPAYLETPNPRTIPFYERHGFKVTGAAQAGGCPPVAFMLRAARA